MTLVIEATHSGLSTHYQPSVSVGHRFTGGPIGLWENEVPLATKDCTWLTVFMVFGLQIMQLLAEETSRYHEYFNTSDEGQCTQPGRI